MVLQDRLKNTLSAMGYYVLDPYPLYQKTMRERGWRDLRETWVSKKPVDGHPNPEGHRLLAVMLKDLLLTEPALKSVFEKEK